MSLSAKAVTALLEASQPDVVELATLAAFAVRIEPALLRALRLELMPGSEAGLEGDLWFSRLVQSRGPDGIVLLAEVAAALHKVLQQRLQAAHPQRRRSRRAWAIIEAAHRERLSPALWLEEQVTWYALSGEGDVEAALAPALAALAREQRSGLAPWAARALPRLPARVRNTPTAWALALTAGRHLPAGIPLATTVAPAGLVDLDLHDAFEPDAPITLLLGRQDEHVQIGESLRNPSHSLQAPDTRPRVVELRWEEDGRSRRKVAAFGPGRFSRLKVGNGPLRLRTLDGRVYQLAGSGDSDQPLRPIVHVEGPWKNPQAQVLHAALIESLRPHCEVLTDTRQEYGDYWITLLDDWLTRCQGAVILLSPDTLRSAAWPSAVLTWRKGLEPDFRLACVTVDGAGAGEPFPVDLCRELGAPVIEAHPKADLEEQLRPLLALFTDWSPAPEPTPLSRWLGEAGDCLAGLDPQTLEGLGRRLEIGEAAWQDPAQRLPVLTRRLLFTDATSQLLRLVEGLHSLSGTPLARFLELIRPLWVPLEAACRIPPVLDRPEGERLLAINTANPETAADYLHRATLNDPGLRIVRVDPWIEGGGEAILGAYAEAVETALGNEKLLTEDGGELHTEDGVGISLSEAQINRLCMLVPEHWLDPELLQALIGHYPAAAWVLMTGETLPDAKALGLSALTAIRPELDPETESRAAAFREQLQAIAYSTAAL